MKYELLKCNWCGKERKRELDSPQPPKPNSPVDNTSWTERMGMMPIHILEGSDTKKTVPTNCKLHLCTNECNQAYKNMETEAEKAANAAWLTIYNRLKT